LERDITQLGLGKDDFDNDTDNGNDTLSAFFFVPNVHSNYCHDLIIVLNSYFDQDSIIQSSLLDIKKWKFLKVKVHKFYIIILCMTVIKKILG
jgi:hypothetical protein